MASVVLVLVPLQKFPIDFKISKWKCPLQNEDGLALSKMKFQDLDFVSSIFEIDKLVPEASPREIVYQLSKPPRD